MNARYRCAVAVLGCGIALPALSAGAATLTVNTAEPTGPGVVIANPHSTGTTAAPGPVGERDTFTTAFSSSTPTSGREDRGQSFQMPDNPTGNAWDLSAITIRADANTNGTGVAQDFSTGGPHSLRLWVFEWNPSNSATTGTNWTAGNGPADNDPFSGTGITNFLVNGELFDVTRSFSGDFLHFNTPGVQLNENTAYGYLVSFESPSTTGIRFDQVRDGTAPNGQSYPNGAFIRSDTTGTTLNAFGPNGDDMVFYVEATPVPEPATVAAALTGVAALAVRRRRRRA
jgi:hypothetical protein